MNIHVVKPNETVYSIARRYGVSVESVIFNNQLYTPSKLAVGQALLILVPKIVHRVRRKDTLYSIAEQYKITVKELVRNNPYAISKNYIMENQNLVIQYQEKKKGKITVAGFAYPFIKNNILYETLPYLSRLCIFSYGLKPDGELIPTGDEGLLDAARQFDVKPILVLTGSNESGNFDNHLISIVLNNPAVQRNLISNIGKVLRKKGYAGIDIDFENVLPQDKAAYVRFMQNLSQALHPEGFLISIDLSPKESRDQKGILYEGLDYGALAKSVDDALLMTYEWGYSQSEPMAVAPINKVREVLNYAVTEIPPEKINLGMPNYGYEWPLPYIENVTQAHSIGNVEAIEIAVKNNAAIQFDQKSMTPYFQYTKEGKSFEIWFEDVRSIYAKVSLVPEYKLKGLGYWNIMRYFRANWLLVNALFQID